MSSKNTPLKLDRVFDETIRGDLPRTSLVRGNPDEQGDTLGASLLVFWADGDLSLPDCDLVHDNGSTFSFFTSEEVVGPDFITDNGSWPNGQYQGCTLLGYTSGMVSPDFVSPSIWEEGLYAGPSAYASPDTVIRTPRCVRIITAAMRARYTFPAGSSDAQELAYLQDIATFDMNYLRLARALQAAVPEVGVQWIPVSVPGLYELTTWPESQLTGTSAVVAPSDVDGSRRFLHALIPSTVVLAEDSPEPSPRAAIYGDVLNLVFINAPRVGGEVNNGTAWIDSGVFPSPPPPADGLYGDSAFYGHNPYWRHFTYSLTDSPYVSQTWNGVENEPTSNFSLLLAPGTAGNLPAYDYDGSIGSLIWPAWAEDISAFLAEASYFSRHKSLFYSDMDLPDWQARFEPDHRNIWVFHFPEADHYNGFAICQNIYNAGSLPIYSTLTLDSAILLGPPFSQDAVLQLQPDRTRDMRSQNDQRLQDLVNDQTLTPPECHFAYGGRVDNASLDVGYFVNLIKQHFGLAD